MKAAQRYVSKELTHFVGRHLNSSEDRYGMLKTILETGQLRPRGFFEEGVATVAAGDTLKLSAGGYSLGRRVQPRLSSNGAFEASVVCFCDIPVEDFEIHMQKYSRFGLAFLKSFLVAYDANPVFYIVKNAVVRYPPAFGSRARRRLPNGVSRGRTFDEFYKEYVEVFGQLNVFRMENNPERANIPAKLLDLIDRAGFLERFWDDLVFSHLLFFDNDQPDQSKKNLYMEREWRVRGALPFSLAKVRRIILPEQFADRFRNDFPNYSGQLTFS
jgi:hypothetical protein